MPWSWAAVVSHQAQRSGQPVRRTNVHGDPARVPSPWIERKISWMHNWSETVMVRDYSGREPLAERCPGTWREGSISGPGPQTERCDHGIIDRSRGWGAALADKAGWRRIASAQVD